MENHKVITAGCLDIALQCFHCDVASIQEYIGSCQGACCNYFVVLCDFIHWLYQLFSSSLLNTTQLGIQSTGRLLIYFKIWHFCVLSYFSDHSYRTSSGMNYLEAWVRLGGGGRSVHVILYKSMDTWKNWQELAEQGKSAWMEFLKFHLSKGSSRLIRDIHKKKIELMALSIIHSF